LVILCLNDHSEAHTLRKLAQDLTPEQIKQCKKDWEEQVRKANASALIGISRVQGANWDYINHTRLFRLADQLNINFRGIAGFSTVKSLDMISPRGEIQDIRRWNTGARPDYYLYELGEGLHLYAYTSKLLESVIGQFGVMDISVLSRKELMYAAEDGRLVFFQGPVYFRRLKRGCYRGAHQMRRAYTKTTALEFDFSFNAWECTSSSSHGDRLSGRKVASIVGLVSGKEVRGQRVFIQLSCLGIGTFFERIHWGNWHRRVESMVDVEGDAENGYLSTEKSLSDMRGL
jgi:hypothetical protein